MLTYEENNENNELVVVCDLIWHGIGEKEVDIVIGSKGLYWRRNIGWWEAGG